MIIWPIIRKWPIYRLSITFFDKFPPKSGFQNKRRKIPVNRYNIALKGTQPNKKRQAKIKIFDSTLLCFSHQIMLRCCITVLRFEINVLLNRSQILGKTNTLPWRAVEGWRGICDSLKDTKACTARGSTFFGFDFITSCM